VCTVVADRLLGLFGLLLFGGTFGTVLWLGGNERILENGKLQVMIAGCAGAAVAGVLAYLLIGFVNENRAERIAAKLPVEALKQVWRTVWLYRQRPQTILLGVALSAFAHTCMMLAFHFAVQVYPPADPAMLGSFAEHCTIAPIGYIIQALIPLPGGVGVSEFTFGGFYELIRPNGGRVVGLTGRLALRLVEWIVGALCYIAYLNVKRTEEFTEASQPAAIGHE